MRLQCGTAAPRMILPSVDGTTFDTQSLRGQRCLVGFFRFAGCPLCNLRLHDLIEQYPTLPDDFAVVAVFDSPLDNLVRHMRRHQTPFPVLADENGTSYRDFGIERSLAGVFRGIATRLPTLIRATCKGYIPLSVQGSMTTMPADFLLDEEGIIRTAWYGRDEGDHLPLSEVARFAESGSR